MDTIVILNFVIAALIGKWLFYGNNLRHLFLKTTLFLFCVSLQVEGGGESEGVRNKALEVNIFQMA